MSKCFVCPSEAAASHEHHVTPQARGGKNGLTVLLCPTCHQSVHNAANRVMAGGTYHKALSHLDSTEQNRARVLVNAIVIAHVNSEDKTNPNPLLAVRLKSHRLLLAAHRLKREKGFTSIEQLFNALLEQVAAKYGL